MTDPTRVMDPTLTDLFIDGRCYRVDPEVLAHFKFMHQQLSNMATYAEKQARVSEELKARLGVVRETAP